MSIVKFGDVVVRANTKEDKDNTDKVFYVGGEHIDSGELLVSKRGIIAGSTIGPMFYFGFKAGQVLLVSRNPHLRKAAMVLFDGICSEKTFVLETKDEGILRQKFLPFILQSDEFWEYAEANKSGSVNFFLNWSTIERYEFYLPPVETQDELSEVLWATNDTRLKYQNLLDVIDDLNGAQLQKLTETSSSTRTFKLKDLLKQHKKSEQITDTKNEVFISVPLYGKGVRKRDMDGEDINPFKGIRISAGQFIYSRIWIRKGACGLVPEELDGAVVTNEFPVFDINTDYITPEFLLYSILDKRFMQKINKGSLGSTSKQRLKESVFLEYEIELPSKEEQEAYSQYVKTSYLVKEKLSDRIEILTRLQRRIMKDHLKMAEEEE